MIQRDYILRLIEQCAVALRRALDLGKGGQYDPALLVVREAEELALGPLAGMLQRLEATSAVAIAGPLEIDRVRLYSGLVAEEGLLHEFGGDGVSSQLCFRRSLELYAALSVAGARLDAEDLTRIAVLTTRVDFAGLDPGYRQELERLRGAPR